MENINAGSLYEIIQLQQAETHISAKEAHFGYGLAWQLMLSQCWSVG